MEIIHPNKTRNQVSVAINSGFFWSDNKEIEFEKRTVKNGIPFLEKHKGIILYPIEERFKVVNPLFGLSIKRKPFISISS